MISANSLLSSALRKFCYFLWSIRSQNKSFILNLLHEQKLTSSFSRLLIYIKLFERIVCMDSTTAVFLLVNNYDNVFFWLNTFVFDFDISLWSKILIEFLCSS